MIEFATHSFDSVYCVWSLGAKYANGEEQLQGACISVSCSCTCWSFDKFFQVFLSFFIPFKAPLGGWTCAPCTKSKVQAKSNIFWNNGGPKVKCPISFESKCHGFKNTVAWALLFFNNPTLYSLTSRVCNSLCGCMNSWARLMVGWISVRTCSPSPTRERWTPNGNCHWKLPTDSQRDGAFQLLPVSGGSQATKTTKHPP
jgi:hypothetical protein